MSNTKRKWPYQKFFFTPNDYPEDFIKRVERDLVPTTLKNEGYWNQKSKAFAKKFRTRLDRIRNKQIQEHEND